MTKIAYLGNYHEQSGYSDAAFHYLNALEAAGFDVVSRRINMIGSPRELPNNILDMEKKDLNGVDVVIQHNLPHTFAYKSDVQNIGAFAYETSSFINSGWKENLALMDKIVVFCRSQIDAVIDTSKELGNKTFLVPHAIDVEKFDKEYKPLDFGEASAVKFYSIADFNKRKNIPATLIAYFSAFSSSDNVLLVLKLGGVSRDLAKKIINDTRAGCRRFTDIERYPKVVLITDRMKDDEICSLHQTCDCFVSSSHGEAWSIPCTDALGFGNYAITTDGSAFEDHRDRGFSMSLADSQKSTVFGVDNAPQGLYTSREEWDNVSISYLSRLMEGYYQLNVSLTSQERKSLHNKNLTKDLFSYKTVGDIYRKVIEVK